MHQLCETYSPNPGVFHEGILFLFLIPGVAHEGILFLILLLFHLYDLFITDLVCTVNQSRVGKLVRLQSKSAIRF